MPWARKTGIPSKTHEVGSRRFMAPLLVLVHRYVCTILTRLAQIRGTMSVPRDTAAFSG